MMNLGNVGIGLILSFANSWTITLVILGFVPLIIVLGVFQSKLLGRYSGKDMEIIQQAGIVSCFNSITLVQLK